MFQNGREKDLPLSPDLNPSIISKEEFNNLFQEKERLTWSMAGYFLNQLERFVHPAISLLSPDGTETSC